MLKIDNHTILVVGDVMIDRYVTGEITRESPEAPVSVLVKENEESKLGGAANVALNLQALGCTPILMGIGGEDDNLHKLKSLLSAAQINHIIVSDENRKTTVKTRVMNGPIHLLRVDEESDHYLSAEKEYFFIETAENLMLEEKVKALVFQDYNKGALSPLTIDRLIRKAKELSIPVIVDPKEENLAYYRGVDILKPNLKELSFLEGRPITWEEAIDRSILKSIREKATCSHLIATLSEHGIVWNAQEDHVHIEAIERNISDVCGAGDTVLSTLVACYISGIDMTTTLHLANIAGGQVCELPGVVTINLEKLLVEYQALTASS